jgi:tetratricopeptide (TPR) repeat protein
MFSHSKKVSSTAFGILALLLFSCTTTSENPPQTGAGSEKAPVEGAAAAADAGDGTEAANAAAVLDPIFTDSGDNEAALAALEKAGVESMDDESRLVYAILLRTEGRMDESKKQLETLVTENPGNALAWYNLALVEHTSGNTARRDEALDSAIKADPAMVDAWAFRGNLAVSRSDWAVAEASLKTALKLEPDSVESMVGLAWVMANTERTKDALPLLNRAVEIAPRYVYARVDRSRVNVALRNYNDAESDLDAAILEEPEVPWHYLDRARIRLRHFKDYEGALEDLETVERLDPGNFFALVYLAGLHDEERRFKEAREYYLKVVKQRPDYVWAYMPLGKFAYMNGDYSESAKWYSKASAEDPQEFSFTLMTALALHRSGKNSEADKMFSEALRRYKPGETAYEVVRFCSERANDYYAVNALNKETNAILRERLWYYMGAIYTIQGHVNGARAVNERIAGRIGEMEFDLAWAALNGFGG